MADRIGTNQPDQLKGTSRADFIDGLGGADTLTGESGDDTIMGGTGRDSIDGGAGDDEIQVSGVDQDAALVGGLGNDTLAVTSEWTTSVVKLDAAASVEFLSVGLVRISGTSKGDLFDFSGVRVNDQVDFTFLLTGNDQYIGGAAVDSASGDSGDDTLSGGGGNDFLRGGAGADVLSAGSGDDTIYAGGIDTTDTFDGGDGADVLYLESDWTISRLKLDGAASIETIEFNATAIFGSQTSDVIDISGVRFFDGIGGRQFKLGFGSDAFVGSQTDDVVFGEAGDDTLTGGRGADYLEGGAGDDVLSGGDGDDEFFVDGSGGSDQFAGGAGNDRLSIDFSWTVSKLTLDAAASVETINFNVNTLNGTRSADAIDISGVRVFEFGESFALAAGDDVFTGSILTEFVSGDDGADTLNGGGGNDELYGGAGGDVLLGGAGDDFMTGDDGDDLYDGGLGRDLFQVAGSNAGVDAFKGGGDQDMVEVRSDLTTSRLILDKAASVETLASFINLFGDTYSILGTDKADRFDLSGVETVRDLRDPFALFDGADVFVGSRDSDEADGGNGDDSLTGGLGADRLTGGRGDDRLEGGEGNDTLVGGANGSVRGDQFVFQGAFGLDRIDDFEAGRNSGDVILLAQSLAGNDAAVLSAARQVGDDVVIRFSSAQTITLEDVALRSLHGDDFSFF